MLPNDTKTCMNTWISIKLISGLRHGLGGAAWKSCRGFHDFCPGANYKKTLGQWQRGQISIRKVLLSMINWIYYWRLFYTTQEHYSYLQLI